MGDIVTIASHVWVDWIALWHRDRAKGFRKRVCFGHIARPGHSSKRLLFGPRAPPCKSERGSAVSVRQTLPRQ